MKLSNEQELRLREMCFERKSNKEIATELGIELTDVFAARSRLGITIPKVEAILAQGEDEPIDYQVKTKITEEEIQREIEKVLKAKVDACKKVNRCDERIAELLIELARA
jgi:hypothetical protein